MHEEGEKDNSDRWLLTYSDLITLLMVFFIVMYAISEADKGKFIQLRSSMQRAFKGDGAEEPDLALLREQSNGILDVPAKQAAIARRDQHPAGGNSPTAELPLGVAPVNVNQELYLQLREVILPIAAERGVAGNVGVEIVDEGVAISLSGNLLFDSGKAELRPEGVIFLHAIADVLRGWPNQIRVEGHTDGVPINTSLYPSNWELSAARAVVTTRYLVEQEQLGSARVGAAAYGDSRPMADNATREGRARNRRIDVLVLNAHAARDDRTPAEATDSATTHIPGSPGRPINQDEEGLR